MAQPSDAPARAAVPGVRLDPSDLLGEWTLARRVADLRERRSGTVEGTLHLRRGRDRIDWVEEGTLCWAGARSPVSRRYVLRRDGTDWWVFFTDGAPFHRWQPGEWVTHPCRADRYRGLVTTESADCWRLLWEVRGPQKCQRLVSWFTRLPSSGIGPTTP